MSSIPRPLLIVLAIAAISRLLLLPINEAEYTDGILMLTQFEQPTGIWPPLYGMLAYLPGKIFGALYGARLVSVIFAVAALIPIWRMAERSFGARAAWWSAWIYIVAPVAVRWAPRVMSESTFLFFFLLCCEQLLALSSAATREAAMKFCVRACAAGALAAMTRYQGMMLIVPAGVAALVAMRRGVLPPKALAAFLLFAISPAWMLASNTIHGEQFADRAGGGAARTLAVFTGNFEPFLLLIPYFLTYPIAGVTLFGLLRPEARPRAGLLLVTAFTAGTLLVVQSFFSSFQERYLLPIFGLLWVFAGGGMALIEESLHKYSKPLASSVIALVLAWSAAFSAFVFWGSHQAFGDLSRATKRAIAIPGERVLWTNEIYRERGDARIAADKVRFFAGAREVEYLTPKDIAGNGAIARGDLIVLMDLAGGAQIAEAMGAKYSLEFLFEEKAVLHPVFPDLMSGPPGSQNPLAWHYRYTPQVFVTRVFEVK